jgi:hypothetical protein
MSRRRLVCSYAIADLADIDAAAAAAATAAEAAEAAAEAAAAAAAPPRAQKRTRYAGDTESDGMGLNVSSR